MTGPIFVTYWTPNYRPIAERGLLLDLERLNLNHIATERPDAGGWVANCAQKPQVIQEVMEAHPWRPVVWVDADARIWSRPHLVFELSGCDIAAHRLMRKGRIRCELLSGTVWIGASEVAIKTVERWCEICRVQPKTWDQTALDQAIQDEGAVLRNLPAEYCMITNRRSWYPDAPDPIIEHFQASRVMNRAGACASKAVPWVM